MTDLTLSMASVLLHTQISLPWPAVQLLLHSHEDQVERTSEMKVIEGPFVRCELDEDDCGSVFLSNSIQNHNQDHSRSLILGRVMRTAAWNWFMMTRDMLLDNVEESDRRNCVGQGEWTRSQQGAVDQEQWCSSRYEECSPNGTSYPSKSASLIHLRAFSFVNSYQSSFACSCWLRKDQGVAMETISDGNPLPEIPFTNVKWKPSLLSDVFRWICSLLMFVAPASWPLS